MTLITPWRLRIKTWRAKNFYKKGLRRNTTFWTSVSEHIDLSPTKKELLAATRKKYDLPGFEPE
jgi:hypothetical protein